MACVPEPFRAVFWDVDISELDTLSGCDYIIPRVLEFGRLVEVQWLISTYGMQGIHQFLREVGHPELSERTLGFWRAVFKAEGESWASSPAWRMNNNASWID
jgi:hypothetical protein